MNVTTDVSVVFSSRWHNAILVNNYLGSLSRLIHICIVHVTNYSRTVIDKEKFKQKPG
jgi:hypothetical protein